MNQILIEYIQNEIIGEAEAISLDGEDDLLGSGLLDSLGMMRLIRFVEEEFDLKVLPEEMVIENFMTVNCITAYVESKS